MTKQVVILTSFLIAVFVCVAALAILDRLDIVDVDTLAWWLAERQLPNGGLNGRPEKLEDVSCVSFSRPSPFSISVWFGGILRVIHMLPLRVTLNPGVFVGVCEISLDKHTRSCLVTCREVNGSV